MNLRQRIHQQIENSLPSKVKQKLKEEQQPKKIEDSLNAIQEIKTKPKTSKKKSTEEI